MSDTDQTTHTPARHVELRTGTPYANLNAAQMLFADTLAARWKLDPESVIPTAGATGAIEAVRNHVLKRSPSKHPTVLTVTPGYWRARESFEGLGFEVVSVRTESGGFNISEQVLADKAKAISPTIVYLSLPNNPTGAVFDPHALVRAMPEETTVLLDLTLPSRDPGARELTGGLYESFKGRSNLFLAGSTSKSHGTAEYRIGWVVCASEKDAAELRGENRSGISTHAIAEGVRCLAERPTVLENIARSFSLLEEGAQRGRFEVVKPERRVESSYVLIKLLAPSGAVRRLLEDAHIHVMWGSEVGLTDEYIRLETIEHPAVEIFVKELNNSFDM
ncbi:MAG: Aminotransferase class [Acidobacteriota bacterium]|jgi:aspartate/methionine/tyrosine aminotransferase|nr:Aminotransferase class [Acidobacteriota bacterium]